jgi:hypothetical protein
MTREAIAGVLGFLVVPAIVAYSFRGSGYARVLAVFLIMLVVDAVLLGLARLLERKRSSSMPPSLKD